MESQLDVPGWCVMTGSSRLSAYQVLTGVKLTTSSSAKHARLLPRYNVVEINLITQCSGDQGGRRPHSDAQ